MGVIIEFLKTILLVVLAFGCGVLIGERGFGKEAERVKRILKKPHGAVFKPKTQEEILKARSKKFYDQI